PLRHLYSCSGCFRLERSPGGIRAHWKAPPCHGARVKRTKSKQGAKSAFDPQRTKAPSKSRSAVGRPRCYLPLRSTGEITGETARVHHASRRRGGRVAARGAGAAGRADAPDRRTDGLAGEGSGSSGGARSVRKGGEEIGLGGRPQFADRSSRGDPRRSGVDASIRERARRVTARPHSFA